MILQLDNYKKVIKTFDNIKSAAQHVDGDKTQIKKAIDFNIKSHGYYWRKK